MTNDDTTPTARLAALGLELPAAPPARYRYTPVVVHGDVAYVSGQVPRVNGTMLLQGPIDDRVPLETARAAARACLLNSWAQLAAAVGGLDRVERLLRVTGYVASAPSFTGQPDVIDGASQLALDVFGDRGAHARTALGVAILPGNAAVELDLIAVVRR